MPKCAKPKTSAKDLAKRPPLTRSEVMRTVKSKNTKPELLVRSFLRGKKIKYRTYGKLPGRPDIVMPEHKAVIRVMGCFWHKHSCKSGNRLPKTNVEYWTNKIGRNVARDKENKTDLKERGWHVIDVWECSLRESRWEERLAMRIEKISLASQMQEKIF